MLTIAAMSEMKRYVQGGNHPVMIVPGRRF